MDEEQATKRFRENDHQGGNEGPRLSNAAGSNSSTDVKTLTFPDEVSECFLSSLRNVELLKTCRLVCTRWNIAASRSLRICSVVCLKEKELTSIRSLADFMALLIGRSFGSLQHLPSPFQNFRVEGRTFTDTIFLSLILHPNISISSLNLDLNNSDIDQSQLHCVLAANKNSITDLLISLDDDFELEGPLLRMDGIHLTALKCLKFHDSCTQCTHGPFIQNVLNTCNPNLESVDLHIWQGDSVVSLLPQDGIKTLKHLKLALDIQDLSTSAWEHLSQLRFTRLKSLKFNVLDSDFGEDPEKQLVNFLHSVSPFLEEFNTNVTISSAPELCFPKLKSVDVENNNSLFSFTPDKFPSLSKVLYHIWFPSLHIPQKHVVTHPGVNSFTIAMPKFFRNDKSSPQKLLTLMSYASRQFPNVSSLVISVGKFQFTTLADLWESFPKLTKLFLDGECDFLSFSGVTISMVTEYLQLGWPIEEIPRRKAIMDFMELQCIMFSRDFVLQPHMIIHCLPRVPKLKHIEFHWNKSLSAPLLRDSVGHLRKIVILNSLDFKDDMAEVSKMLPNVRFE